MSACAYVAWGGRCLAWRADHLTRVVAPHDARHVRAKIDVAYPVHTRHQDAICAPRRARGPLDVGSCRTIASQFRNPSDYER